MMEKVSLLQRIEAHLGAVLATNPEHREGRLLYGLLLYNVPPFLGRAPEAIDHLDALIATARTAADPAPADAYVALGDLYQREGRAEDAKRVWTEGRTRHPADEALVERLRADPANPEEERPGDAADATEAMEPGPSEPPSVASAIRQEALRPEVPGMAIAIAIGDQTLLLEGFGLADVENHVPMTPDSVVRIGSVTKQFTAVVAARLAEDGLFDLDDPVAPWQPESLQPALKGITFRHLLTHTAGLPRDVVEGGDWLRDSLATPRIGAPGERFGYSNLGYAVLGRTLELISGETFSQLLGRRVLEPAGLGATALCDERAIVPHRAQGYTWRGDRLLNDDLVRSSASLLYAGGLCSTAMDLLQWQRALHQGTLLSSDTYRELVTPPLVAAPEGTTYAGGFRAHAPNGHPVLHHSGGITGFLSEVAYYPEHDLSIVVLTNSEAGRPRELGFRIAELALGAAEPVR
jgi:CubicO group peptidase (beta-lactamase class C family)